MRTVRKVLMVWVLAILSVSRTFGQDFDEERMQRDLQVAENVLGTLMSGERRFQLFDKIESNYIPDFGVIFSLPQSIYPTSVDLKGSVVYVNSGSRYVVGERNDRNRTVTITDMDKESKEKEEVWEDAMEDQKQQLATFLVDYADLIGQLKPSDRVLVQLRGRNERLFFPGASGKMGGGSLSAQVLKNDLTAYKQGKMDRDEAMEKVQFTTEEDLVVNKDVELFTTIFARLYEPDLSTTYYSTARNIGYTQLEGFGITFRMKVYSSSSDGDLHTIRTTGQFGLSQEERDKVVDGMYPEFEQTFKENLIDYGRTLRSLKDDEKIMFKVELTECKNCDMPEEIEVSVSGKTLKAFDDGDLSREKALSQVSVKRL